MFTHIVLVVTAILRIIGLTQAAPSPSPGIIKYLSKRTILNWEDCGDNDDPRRQKAGQAFTDAAQLARWTSDNNLDDSTAFASTKASEYRYQKVYISALIRTIVSPIIMRTRIPQL